ncbi:MAG: response regulator [Parcubacteria group bacterium]|jgi:DNA-binding response OmpR family regulator
MEDINQKSMEEILGEKKLVCIVDDDAMIREMYSTKFRLEGFDVISAVNGEEGLALIRERKPDVVLLDMLMPVKGGMEVLEEMKRDITIRTTPVVVLSNLSDEKTYNKVGKYDAHFYVVKALATPQKVVDIVHEVLHW